MTYYQTEKGKENITKAIKKYRASEKGKGKNTRKEYLASESGKEKLKAYMAQDEVRKKQREYRNSEEGKAKIEAYFASEEGKEARKRAYERYGLKKKIKEKQIKICNKVLVNSSFYGIILNWILKKIKR